MPPFDEDYNNQDSQAENNIFNNQELNHQESEVHPTLIEQKQPAKEAQDPLLRRADTAYQILATGILRAHQSKQELQTRIDQTSSQIKQSQNKLIQISEQLLEDQGTSVPQNLHEVTAKLHAMQCAIRDDHYQKLLLRLNELQQASHKDLPEIINAMRAELDVIEIRTQKIDTLEELKEAYTLNQYFHQYYDRVDQEFRRILTQY